MPPLRFLPLSICALLTPVLAQADATTPAPSLLGHMGQMLVGLGIVIILLFACLWVIKRLTTARGSAAALKVLGGAAVGPRERVVLVEIGNTVLVLGVAPGNVRTLHQMKADELPATSPSRTPLTSHPGAHFSTWLKQAMDKQKNG